MYNYLTENYVQNDSTGIILWVQTKINLLKHTLSRKIVFQKTVTKSSNVPETGKNCRCNIFFVLIFSPYVMPVVFKVSYKKVCIGSYDFMTIFGNLTKS